MFPWKAGNSEQDVSRADAGTESEFAYFRNAAHCLNGNCSISHYIMEAKFSKGICFSKGKVLAN